MGTAPTQADRAYHTNSSTDDGWRMDIRSIRSPRAGTVNSMATEFGRQQLASEFWNLAGRLEVNVQGSISLIRLHRLIELGLQPMDGVAAGVIRLGKLQVCETSPQGGARGQRINAGLDTRNASQSDRGWLRTWNGVVLYNGVSGRRSHGGSEIFPFENNWGQPGHERDSLGVGARPGHQSARALVQPDHRYIDDRG